MISITLNLPEGHPMAAAILALLASQPVDNIPAPDAETPAPKRSRRAKAEDTEEPAPKRSRRAKAEQAEDVDETDETDESDESDESDDETVPEPEADDDAAVTPKNYKDPVIVQHAKGKGTVTVTRLASLMRRAMDVAGPDAIKAVFKKAGVSRLDDLPPAKVAGVVAQLNDILEG